MSEFFTFCKSSYMTFEGELLPFSINWISATCVNMIIIYRNTCVRTRTCYNETFDFEAHFDTILFKHTIRIEFSDFYFFVKKNILYKMSKRPDAKDAQQLIVNVRPYWISTGAPLKDDYEICISLTFGDKS